MRRVSILIAGVGLVLMCGCGDKKKAAPQEEAMDYSCETDADCQEGEVCLAKECATTAPGAIYSDPGRAVTPEKVKSQVEQIQEQAQKRADEILGE